MRSRNASLNLLNRIIGAFITLVGAGFFFFTLRVFISTFQRVAEGGEWGPGISIIMILFLLALLLLFALLSYAGMRLLFGNQDSEREVEILDDFSD